MGKSRKDEEWKGANPDRLDRCRAKYCRVGFRGELMEEFPSRTPSEYAGLLVGKIYNWLSIKDGAKLCNMKTIRAAAGADITHALFTGFVKGIAPGKRNWFECAQKMINQMLVAGQPQTQDIRNVFADIDSYFFRKIDTENNKPPPFFRSERIGATPYSRTELSREIDNLRYRFTYALSERSKRIKENADYNDHIDGRVVFTSGGGHFFPEGYRAVSKALADAAIAGITVTFIIHGKGTLKDASRDLDGFNLEYPDAEASGNIRVIDLAMEPYSATVGGHEFASATLQHLYLGFEKASDRKEAVDCLYLVRGAKRTDKDPPGQAGHQTFAEERERFKSWFERLVNSAVTVPTSRPQKPVNKTK